MNINREFWEHLSSQQPHGRCARLRGILSQRGNKYRQRYNIFEREKWQKVVLEYVTCPKKRASRGSAWARLTLKARCARGRGRESERPRVPFGGQFERRWDGADCAAGPASGASVITNTGSRSGRGKDTSGSVTSATGDCIPAIPKTHRGGRSDCARRGGPSAAACVN